MEREMENSILELRNEQSILKTTIKLLQKIDERMTILDHKLTDYAEQIKESV